MGSAIVALFAAGVRLQSSFRAAMVSGLVTNAFFGAIRTAVFLAVYRRRDEVAGLELADALTYVWVLQATFSIVYSPWQHELSARIRSGEWTAELTRPGSPLARHAAHDLGRCAAVLLLRSPWPLLGAALVLDLRLPTDVAGWALFAVSLGLAAAGAGALRFLVGSIAFWSPDHRAIYQLLFGPLYLFSGFIIPVELFPGVVGALSQYGPLSALVTAPVAVATGRDVATMLGVQVLWVAVTWVACQAVLDRATRRVVAFGG